MENRFVMHLVLFGLLAGFVLTAYSWNKTAEANGGVAQAANHTETETGQDGAAAPSGEEPAAATKKIALTFDDGPGKYTEKLLDGLKERNVKATFFVIGINAESHRDTLKRAAEEGHLIGNHTYNHVRLIKMSVGDACTELRNTNELIFQITGQRPVYVRPPYGEWSDALSESCYMTRVLWSIDPLDWSIHNTEQIVEHVVEHAKDGSIILLHDVFEESVDAALEIIDRLQQMGFTFVRIDQMGENPKIHVN